jgi:hypothetical protein
MNWHPVKRLALLALVTSSVLLSVSASVRAQGREQAPGPSASAPAREPSCVSVEVNGERAPAYDCLTRQLMPPAARAGAPDPAGDPRLAAERIALRPNNALGQANIAATQTRMGNGWGKGVTPQRPPPAEPVSPVVPGRR